MTKTVSLELFEDELEAVVQAGGYQSEQQPVGHALEVLLAANPHLRVSTAVELYRRGKVTLSRAAEIAQPELSKLPKVLSTLPHSACVPCGRRTPALRSGAE